MTVCALTLSIGQSDSMELSRNAAIGVDVYVLVFSVTSRASLEQLIELNDVLYNMVRTH